MTEMEKQNQMTKIYSLHILTTLKLNWTSLKRKQQQQTKSKLKWVMLLKCIILINLMTIFSLKYWGKNIFEKAGDKNNDNAGLGEL